MLKRSAFITLPPDKAEPWETALAQPLESIQLHLEKNNVQRLPLLDEGGRLKYVIHLTEITKFRSKNAAATPPPTLKTLLEERELEAMFSSFAVVDVTATLADAKATMDAIKQCEDVFVTADGKRTGVVVGWITDNDIQAAARL